MRKVTDFLLFPHRNPRYEEMKKHGVYESLKISIIFIPAMFFAMLLFLLLSYIWPEAYGDAELLMGYRSFYYALLACMVVYEIMMVYAYRRFEAIHKKLLLVNSLTAIVLVGWALRMSSLDYVAYHNRVEPTFFIIVSICIPFFLHLDVRFYILLTVCSNLYMVSMFLRGGVDAAFNESNLGDYIVYIFVQLILGVTTFYYKSTMRENLLELQEQQSEIRQLNEVQDRFFSNMSHEIRTPINTIIGLNEMILRQDASPEINEDARNIKSASGMLLHLINDILDISKLQSGQMQLNVASYNTRDMLTDIVGMMSIRAKEKKLSFYVDVSPDIPLELMGDEIRIKQILLNVLNNAIKYTDEGQVRLFVQCDRAKDQAWLSFTVSDTGKGIKKESIPYLFTAYKRIDEDKNKFIEGTGLGLSIVKQFIDLMEGKITVNSVYTKGSTFVIEIPQTVLSEETVGEMDMNNRQASRREYNYVESFEAADARILVVDDTRTNLMVVEKLLRGTKVQIDTVLSGEEALKKTVETYYHVILMDHMMPEMDGIECLHKIRKQAGGLCHKSKILALTANAGSEMRTLYEKEGFDGYLMKPVTGEELENTIYRYLPKDLVTVTGSSESLAEESVEWIHSHKKKKPIRITTGSVADLPNSLMERYDIAAIPHVVMTDDGVFRDGLEIDTRGLLSYMQNPDVTVYAVPPDEEQYEKFFSEQLDEANNIIHIAISSGVKQAGKARVTNVADDFGNVTVVDSGHLSSGIGLMAIEAARMAENGKTVEEIVAACERMKNHIHTSFMVDSLQFLVRQKHVGTMIGRLADAFMVHPVVKLKKGSMIVDQTYFGSREEAWRKYINAALNVPGTIDKRMLFITYVGMTAADLERVKAIVEKKISFKDIYIQKASPSIAANCGPGTFGLLFLTEY